MNKIDSHYFEIGQKTRESYIDEVIMRRIPDDKLKRGRVLIESLVVSYEGLDFDALFILGNAAQEGRLDEFMKKLKAYHSRSLCHVPASKRSKDGSLKENIKGFIDKCYAELGLKRVEYQGEHHSSSE